MHRPLLRRRVGNAGHVFAASEYHVQVAAVICAAAGVELEVAPLAQVAVSVHGYAMLGASGGFCAGGAGEGFEVTGLEWVSMFTLG